MILNLAHAKRMLAHLEHQALLLQGTHSRGVRVMSVASASLSNPPLPLTDGLKVYLGTLTTPQQLALLTIGGGSLGKRVAQRLAQSTVRAGLDDYLALVKVGLAHQGKRGNVATPGHVVTPRGDRCARMLARVLATDLKIPIKPIQATGSFQRIISVSQSTW
jgi:hypothetical protein